MDENKKQTHEETVEDVFNTLTDKQKMIVYAIVGQALEDAKGSNDEEDEKVRHNVFDSYEEQQVHFNDGTFSDPRLIFSNVSGKNDISLKFMGYGYVSVDFRSGGL